MNCPTCSTPNNPTFKFCLKCGTPLSTSGTAKPPERFPAQPFSAPDNYSNPHPPTYPNQTYPQMPPGTFVHQNPPNRLHDYVPNPPPNQYSPYNEQPSNYPYNQQPYSPPSNDLASMNIWGPFAGYGTRCKHIGWLMDNKGSFTSTLIEKVSDKFHERQIPNAQLNHEILTARGIYVENRPYFMLRRNLVTVALYITEFGKDLFISLASYIKPPISNFRGLFLCGMILFYIFMVASYGQMLTGSILSSFGGGLLGGSYGGESNSFVFLLCCMGPLGFIDQIALMAFLVMSIYKWLTEKDFWALLRVPPNEFNKDDLMAMEKAVEQTVRISIDEIGLDPNDLKPVDSGDGKRLI